MNVIQINTKYKTNLKRDFKQKLITFSKKKNDFIEWINQLEQEGIQILNESQNININEKFIIGCDFEKATKYYLKFPKCPFD